MKVLAINGSPHPQGTTSIALQGMCDQLLQQDIETEIVQVGQQAIRGCIGCSHCSKPGVHGCVFADDPVNACFEKMRGADGLIIASPVYYGGIAGTMKCFLDRFFHSGAPTRFKIGAAFTCVRRTGGIEAYHQLNNYLTLGQMVIVPTQYWNVVHGNGQDVLQDGEGIQILKNLAVNMAWLLRSLEEGGKQVSLPTPGPRVRTDFIH